MSSSRATTIAGYCENFAKRMEDTWQRLPVSPKLEGAPPIPLQATVAKHKGSKEIEASVAGPSPSVYEAIDAVLLNADRPVTVVFGDPGAGKSATLQWAARGFAKRLEGKLPSPEIPVPVYVDLSDWNTHYVNCESLDSLLVACRPRELGDAAHILWFLDGLDIVPGVGKKEASAVLRDAHKRASAEEQFVFSTRPMIPVDAELAAWTESWCVNLVPLAREAREAWVRDHCSEAETLLAKFEEDNPQAVGFLDIPLLFAMVLSACLDLGKKFKCNKYPGRAGLFDGFVTYALIRDTRRVSREDRLAFKENLHKVVEGVCWAMLVSRHEEHIPPDKRLPPDRIPQDRVGYFLEKAFDSLPLPAKPGAWQDIERILSSAGLFRDLPGEGVWKVIHQQFAEHWAAKQLARRLGSALAGDLLDLEFWEHFEDKRLDPVTSQALAVFYIESEQANRLDETLNSLKRVYVRDVASLLATTGARVANEFLTSSARSEDSAEREIAACLLAKLGGDQGTEALLALLNDPNERVRHAAICSLSNMPRSAQIVESFLALLHHEDRVLRIYAMDTLLGWHCPEAVDTLMRWATDTDHSVRKMAADRLGVTKDERGLDTLMALASDKVGAVRSTAISMLALRLREERTAEFLSELLHHAVEPVRKAAILALAHLKRREALDPLLAWARNPEEELRFRAVSALASFEKELPVEQMVGFLSDPDEAVRIRALNVLDRWDLKDIGQLLRLLEDPREDVRRSAARPLLRMKSKGTIEPLIALLRDGQEDTKPMVAMVLGELMKGEPLQPLVALLRHSDKEVRKAAGAVLMIMETRESWEQLAAFVQDSDESLQRLATLALARLKPSQAVEPLLAWARDPEESWRLSCVRALRQLKNERVTETLVGLLNDADTGIAWAAAEGLGELVNENTISMGGILARAKGVPYAKLRQVADQVDRRLAPPELEKKLAEQRRKRDGLKLQAEVPEKGEKRARPPARALRKTKTYPLPKRIGFADITLTVSSERIRVSWPGKTRNFKLRNVPRMSKRSSKEEEAPTVVHELLMEFALGGGRIRRPISRVGVELRRQLREKESRKESRLDPESHAAYAETLQREAWVKIGERKKKRTAFNRRIGVLRKALQDFFGRQKENPIILHKGPEAVVYMLAFKKVVAD